MGHAGGLYYEAHGPADAPALILSAGLGGSGGYWAPNLSALAERHRVIVYDHRGTGKSDSAIPDPIAIDDMARDVIALMASIGLDRADLIGHALGGIVGLALARIAPDRLDKLVVVNGWAKTDPVTLRCFDARLHILNDGGPTAYLAAQPIFLFPASWIAENGQRLDGEAASHVAHFQPVDTLRARIAAIAAFDATPWIADLTTPTLALGARDDVLAPYTASEALAAANENFELSLMDWGGHACNVTDPDTFNRIVLDFLRS
ncbi:pyrimidine utilization protein D [Sphingomonas sp.]|jgi:aminoacrylate hydrolase|uniref:pyrimidine utilization protein D n=1 Tax=Sphingomonas sp. TaxID=28214 RepID=UPI002E361279|nr:pyrimidine utilization protein D [Sphingomonas sp.]HEX4693687.1 pyrimidine utilization protein D [Sphingomonas sp.]